MYLMSWKLVEEKVECSGKEEGAGVYSDIGNCADKCKNKASMFIFGTNDYGDVRCGDWGNGEIGCNCICESAAYPDGTCEKTSHNGYRLYRYENGTIE